MPQWKAGGYLIRQYATDHDPPHVHVYRDHKLIAKVVVPYGTLMFLPSKNHRAAFSPPSVNATSSTEHITKAAVMSTNLKKLHTRLIEAVSYDKQNGTLSVRFDDGDLATATLEALKLPDKPITRIAIDEFGRGVEVHFRDRSTHDISADYFTWLTQPDFAAAYPADASLGPRVGANIVSLRRQRRLSQAALAAAAGMAAPNLSRLESGRHVPTLDILLRVANALGVSLAALIRSTGYRTSLSRLPTKRRITRDTRTRASRSARQAPRARSR